MLDPDSETTATTIALGIGLHSAKDVTNRLTALHKRNIVSKSKRNRRVYWSIENTSSENNIELDLTIRDDSEVKIVDGGEYEHDTHEYTTTTGITANSPTSAKSDEPASIINGHEQNEYFTNLHELLTKNLTATIEHLHQELNFLKEELRFKNREMNDFFVYHSYNNCVPLINKTPPSDQIPSHNITYVTCPSCRSWSTLDSNNRATTSPKTPTEPYVLTTTEIEEVNTPPTRNHETPSYNTIWSPVSSKKCSPSKSPSKSPTMPKSFISENRFAALSIDTDMDTDTDDIEPDTILPSASGSLSQNIVSPPKSPKPSIFVNNHPENVKFTSKSKPVERKKPCIAIVGDSMIKHISSYKVRSIVNNIDCYVRPNLGAEVEDIMDKLRPDIRKRKTDIVVIHVGINDCRSDNYALWGTAFNYELLLDWLESEGVIPIVSLTIFTDNNLINNRARNINKVLVDLCIRKNINYISNANITRNHLYDKGNHLNSSGSDLLCDNICGFLNFIIPYIYPN